MALLNKADVLQYAGSCDTREVSVPKWGGEVLVRGMTIKEFELNQARADDGEATAAVMTRCVLADASGLRMFSDDDASLLSNLPLAEVSLISKAIMELSGLGGDDAPKSTGEAVEDAVKNSETTPNSSSGTD